MAGIREIRLLGEPAIIGVAGDLRDVRGQQAWAVLARVLLSRRPLDRRQLSAELFPDAADPLGALRWCLAALRRALDEPLALRGDPIQPGLPDDIRIDVRELETRRALTDDPGDLLDGIDLRATIEFSTWLLVERQRLAALVEEALRGECLRAMAGGDTTRAISLAEKAVRRSPLDESMHILLVKALSVAGRSEAAQAHAEDAERRLTAELGDRPSNALRNAARRMAPSPAHGISPAAQARSLLASGKAALSAGAVDAGIDALRRAADEAANIGDDALHCEILLELGTALIHAVRSHDDEGAVLMRQAAALAEKLGTRNARSAALRELGYVEALAGRRPSAAAYLDEASGLTNEPDRQAGIHSVIGFNLVDWGRVEDGLAAYRHALELARSCGSRRREAWCLGLGARGLLAAEDHAQAREWLDDCLAAVDDMRWIAFRPWAVALRAEAMLGLATSPAALRPELEDAFAMSCELGDPCWQGAVGRVIALTYARDADWDEALRWLGEAHRRTGHDVNPFAAQLVDILEDQARVLSKAGRAEAARQMAQDWIAQAARIHMHASVSRAAQFIREA